jgi:hypothetical protein
LVAKVVGHEQGGITKSFDLAGGVAPGGPRGSLAELDGEAKWHHVNEPTLPEDGRASVATVDLHDSSEDVRGSATQSPTLEANGPRRYGLAIYLQDETQKNGRKRAMQNLPTKWF